MKKHHIPAGHFMEQFHNHHHYVEYGPDERRPEWWELPEPRARGGRIDFRKGGPVGYAHGGGVERLQQNLHQSFGDLNRQVAASQQQPQATPAAGNYQAMPGQATGQTPNDAYQRMLAQALNGKTYNDLFPTASKPAPAAPTPAAAAQPEPSADAVSYYSNPYNVAEMMGGDGSYKRGGKVNIVERALAVTRRR